MMVSLLPKLRQLFGAMRGGGFLGVEQIPHFDGGLFDDDEVLELDAEGMRVLHRVSALDWGSIEPAILGTLFERSLDPSKRAQLGAHYTSRENIVTIVETVLMARCAAGGRRSGSRPRSWRRRGTRPRAGRRRDSATTSAAS